MDLSISTDIYWELSPEKALEMLLKTPFRNFEYGHLHLESWIEEGINKSRIKNTKKVLDYKKGKLIQIHAPIFNFIEDEDAERKLKWCEDTLKFAYEMNANWVVIHPGSKEGWQDDQKIKKEVIKENIKVLKSLINKAKKNKTGIAIENMNKGKFGSKISDLQLLLDSLTSSNIAICWDTSHANLALCNQIKEMRKLKNNIVTTHISDNRGENDDHILPLKGEINWKSLILLLSELDLPFNFEIPGEKLITPLEIRNIVIKYGYELGKFLINKYGLIKL